jgi:hypothetical protein
MIWLSILLRSTGAKMTTGLNDIIRQLEQQGKAIERALSALREVGDTESASAPAAEPAVARGRRKGKRKGGGMTPEGRKRLSEALRARWAAKRAGSAAPAKSVPVKAAPAQAVRKGGMTPEGRKRLSEALRKRWAAKRAGSATATKKAARKS